MVGKSGSGKHLSTSQSRGAGLTVENNEAYYRDRYKNAKAQLRAFQKVNEETAAQLHFARKEISRLQKQQSSYLNELVEKQSPSSSDDAEPGFDSGLARNRKTARLSYSYSFRTPHEGSMPRGLKVTKRPSNTGAGSGKDKKRRIARDPDKVRRVQVMPTNPDGTFKFPTQVSIFTIISLGTVEYERTAFHSDRYLLPIGYKVLRYYRSTIDPNAQACYTSSILDGGTGPRFEVVADDRPGEPFVSDTPSGAWTQILKLASKVRNLQVANSGSGPEYFGLAHPTISYMIQNLPNANRCVNYRWQKFEVAAPNPSQSRPWPAPPAPPSPREDDESEPTLLSKSDDDNSSSSRATSYFSDEESATNHEDEPSKDFSSPAYGAEKDSEETKAPKKFRIWE